LPYEISKIKYSGNVKEVKLGSGKKAVSVGGGNSYPFHLFEGESKNRPKIAMEIWDMKPDDWAEAALEPFKDVADDPVAWAKKCVDEYGAEMIVIQLKSTDPNGMDRSADEAAATVKKVVDSLDVPIIVWGVANVEKDAEVLKKVAEACEGKHIALGPVEEANHKQIGAAALGYKHTIISSSPIDVNLAKQVNILLQNLGVQNDLLIDPTTGGLGYGLEYSYSVIERIRMAGLIQEDEKLQYPIISNLGNEVWKSKEAKLSKEEGPNLGEPAKRGYLMEAVGAVSYLLAGADLLIMRHPESVKLIKNFIDLMINGGAAYTDDSMSKKLSRMKEMPQALGIDVKFERKKAEAEAKKPAAAKPAAPKEEKKAAPKPAEKPAEPVKEKAAAPAPAAEKPVEDAAKTAANKEAAEKAAAQAAAEKAAKEAADKVAAEKAAKDAAEKAAKEKAEKAAAEEAAKKAAEKAARKQAEADRRAARMAEKESRGAEVHVGAAGSVSMTAAEIQLTKTQKLMRMLDRVNKRI